MKILLMRITLKMGATYRINLIHHINFETNKCLKGLLHHPSSQIKNKAPSPQQNSSELILKIFKKR